MHDTTDNAFLGGRLRLLQPRCGYRAGVDPVLLAAAVPARFGQRALDLGCGVGTALFCLAARVPGLSLAGVEIQSEYASLARENARRNDLDADIFTCDVKSLPAEVAQRDFDHVIANPPYFDRRASHASPLPGREQGRGASLGIEQWVRTAAKRLRPGGYASFVLRVESLPDLISIADAVLGSIEVLPLAPRMGRPAKLVLLRARKGGSAAFRLFSPLVLHAGATHSRDAESYTEVVSRVLREAAPLSFDQCGAPNTG